MTTEHTPTPLPYYWKKMRKHFALMGPNGGTGIVAPNHHPNEPQNPLLDKILRAINSHEENERKIKSIVDAASKWPRCCDQWQDGLGGMHCRECSQKTFAMLFLIQQILGMGRDGKIAKAEGK